MGIGIDADQSALGGTMLRLLARRAARIEVRDATSRDILRSWHVESVLRPDLSSLMPAAPPSVGRHLLAMAGADGPAPVRAPPQRSRVRAIAPRSRPAHPPAGRRPSSGRRAVTLRRPFRGGLHALPRPALCRSGGRADRPAGVRGQVPLVARHAVTPR